MMKNIRVNHYEHQSLLDNGRGGGIRTHDLLLPKQQSAGVCPIIARVLNARHRIRHR